ncbi:MAG: AAA family ATPase, partial [Deltaproteobacteria bacterium]|nr:AAA family ATPase [Deltaproteobacteria bacterium]
PSLRATLFDLPSRGPTLAGEGLQDKEGAPEILGNGDRVAALVDYLLRRDRQAFDRFVRAACAHIPGAVDLHVTVPSPSARDLALKIDSGAIFDAEELSAGVRLMLFFLAIAHHPSPPELILLEEPEKGVHPRRLAGL